MNQSAKYLMLIGCVPLISFAQTQPEDVSEPFITVNPNSTLRVGIDYDGDHQVDEYRDIKGSDLINLASDRYARTNQPLPSDRAIPETESLSSITGRIQDLKQVRLEGLGGRHVVAQIKTAHNGSRVVDLGPKDQIDPLGIDKGQTIIVHGVQGSINRNKMLMATELDFNGRQVQIQRPLGSNELRFAGKIQKMAVRDLGRGRTDDVLALVELPDNEKVMVDLGSSEALKQQNIDLSRHDRVVFMAVGGSMEGKDLLHATQLSADGHTVTIDQNAPFYGTLN
ncbi:MAG: hypothetical protein LLF76_08890 [Planctomycetaceae bacterium]|nr:hypothetical protein [Planctomycetaceae bacterium]